MNTRLGVNVHQPGPPALNLAQRLGVGSVRVDGNWNDVQHGPDQWDWRQMDESVYGARARGLEVLLTIGYTPEYLSGGARINPPPVDAWTAFVQAIATRYRHNIWFFEIWNEPNALYAGSVEQYVDEILTPAAEVLRRFPENRVIAPALSTEGTWAPWLKTCLARGRDAIDIVSVHSYQDDGRAVWRALGGKKAWWEVWKELGIRQVIAAAGCGHKAIWLTETGWWADNADSEAKQADNMDQLIEGLAGNPWLERLFYYQLIDEPQEKRGLYRLDGSPKPAAVEMMRRFAGIPLG